MVAYSKLPFINLEGIPRGLPFILSGAALLGLISLTGFVLIRPKKLGLPIVGEPESTDYRQALIDGTAKYPDRPFIIPTAPAIVILPIATINEIRNLPENKASFIKDVRRSFESKHTGIGTEGPEVIQAVKIDLTRHIASTLDDLQEEIKYGLDKEFGLCENWTKFIVYGKVTRLVALLSGRVFVGRPLSREEKWIDATIMFTLMAMQGRQAIASWPEWARSLVAPHLSEIKMLWKFKKRGAKLLSPILAAQLAKEGNEKLHYEDLKDEQGTFISWLLKYTKEKTRHDAEVLANNQMSLSMAAIHTTSMAITAALYDLAAYPSHIKPLRDEIKQVIAEDGQDIDCDGFMRLKKSSIPKLWKLDSFLKESQRLTPPQLLSNTRITTSPVHLSTGHTLPTNTRFAFAAWALQTNPPASLSLTSQIKPLSEFDGLRHYNLRHIPGNQNRHQFVTTSPESLNFGHGNHACPGRFFASNEIKVVLIELLMRWEFRFVDDQDMEGGSKRRPLNTWHVTTCAPNMKAEMELRRRTIGA